MSLAAHCRIGSQSATASRTRACGAEFLLQSAMRASVGLAINLIELPRFCMAVRLALGAHAGQSATAVALDA